MQQTQQLLLSVKHKLPEPNSILPSQLMKSQQARHIRKRVHDVQGLSSQGWALDRGGRSNRECIAEILGNYYGRDYDLCELFRVGRKIVFLNPMVHPSEAEDQNYYFGSICSNPTKPRKSLCNPLVHQSTYQLEFDDKLESGNLYFALQHEPGVYLLANRLDYNTRSYGQWFYFKVKNVTQVGGVFRFCIVNMTKNGTLFGRGLKVSVCRKGVWSKEGTEIEYMQNKFVRKGSVQNKTSILTNSDTYYTLTFSLHIDSHETIFISYNQPYTYTKLGRKLDSLMHQHANLSRSVIARTPLGNRIQILTITNKNSLKNKKIIFITARAHPVQTAGSFVVEGIIDELLKPTNAEAVNSLLDNFIIKIVPMINPDGVIIGNSRCNLYGFDLNRQWKDPVKATAPQIMALKRTILKYEGRIEMFLDLHGHSTKKSVFAYGCHDVKNPVASREFPFLLSKLSEKDFVYNQCRFSMLTESKNSGKDGTARVSLWRRLKIPNIFTIENSYCCAEGSEYHYDAKSYAKIGKDIVASLCSYFRTPDPTQQATESTSLTQSMPSAHFVREMLLSELHSNPTLINSNVRCESEVSSDSEPEDRVQRSCETPKRLNRDMSSKIYLKARTEKVNKESILKNNLQLRGLKKNTTLETRPQKQQQPNEQSYNTEHKFRRKYLRNLSPLTKDTLPVKSLKQEDQSKQEHPLSSKRGDSQPQLNKEKDKGKLFRQTNAVSIIQIGMGMEGELEYAREGYEMIKAVSAKNINSEYGIYHNRLNTINSSANTSNKPIPMTKLLKNIICPGQDIEYFTDYNQFRPPVLKVKKNVNRNVSKLQEFISKINTIPTGVAKPMGNTNAPLITIRNNTFNK